MDIVGECRLLGAERTSLCRGLRPARAAYSGVGAPNDPFVPMVDGDRIDEPRPFEGFPLILD